MSFTTYTDKENNFNEVYNSETGLYLRSKTLDTREEPFMRDFPNLIDIGIMGKCECSGKCKVDCYQKAGNKGSNMSTLDFERICKEAKGRVFSFALGGKGDPDTHEDFEKILKLSREYGITPNYTTSGILMNKEKAKISKEYCGAVAVSWHNEDYTTKALNTLINSGVKTNIHYILNKGSITDAIRRIKEDDWVEGVNAIVFLQYKPIGYGKREKMLNSDHLSDFFNLIDSGSYRYKIGFDSCSTPLVIQHSKTDRERIDYCEGARFSLYIDSNMNAMPCSFCNQDSKYFVNLRETTIKEAWESEIFNSFRKKLNTQCSGCSHSNYCSFCPIGDSSIYCGKRELY